MQKGTLLFIDDEVQLLGIYRKFYAEKNYRVLTALSGYEGLEIAQAEKPDVIILDLRMPKLDGYHFLKKLRQQDRNTKVVVLTGFGNAEKVRLTSDLGISDFITKPFDLNDLMRVLDEVIAKSKK